jgi:hypothetical protein
MRRKILIGTGALLGLVLVLLLVLPMIFKKDIEAIIKKQINENINAQVNFGDLDLTFFRHFPSLSVSLSDLTVVGVDVFKEDTLAAIKRFDLVVNPWGVITGSGVEVRRIYVAQPHIFAHILPNGKANWDIAKPDTAKAPVDTSKSTFKLSLKSYAIAGGRVRYLDEQGKMAMLVEDLNHEGSGNFNANIFDLATNTQVKAFTFVMDGARYANRLNLAADVTLNMDLDKSRYAFKQNWFRVNDLKLGLDGWVQMRAAGKQSFIDMDLKFQALETQLKNILSLVPGVYGKNFENIKTDGKLALTGYAKGTYGEKQMPGYGVELMIADGSVKTPELPEPIQNLKIDLKVDNATGLDKDLSVLLKTFHAEMAGNPFDATASVRNLSALDFAFTGKGLIDLGKVSKFASLPAGTELAGKINADLSASGRGSEVQNKKMDNVKASGTVKIEGLAYREPKDLPQGVTIATANLAFNQNSVALTNYQGTVGKSDIALNGTLGNFIPYALGKGTLQGTLALNSNKLDVNEWMSTDTTTKKAANPADTLTVIEVPGNIDFTFTAAIKQVLYDKLVMNDFKGSVLVRNQAVKLQNCGFNALDGGLVANGEYNTQNAKSPAVAMDLDCRNVNIAKAFEAFSMLKTYVPVAQYAQGFFNTDAKFSCRLLTNMMPDMKTVNAKGRAEVMNCEVKDMPILNKLSGVLKVANVNDLKLEKAAFDYEIKDGRLYVKPFDVTKGDYKLTIGGSNGLDKSLDYDLDVDMPSGQVGQMAQEAASRILGQNVNLPQRIKAAFKVGGTFANPTVNGLGLKKGSGGAAAPSPVDQGKQAVQQQVDKAKEDAQKKLQEEADKAKEEAKKKLEEEAQRLKEEAKKKLKLPW